MKIIRKGKTGTLYVVATPIGNLEDLSPRALSVLSRVDLVLAEDTRRCRRLAAHFKLRLKLRSCHAHNEARRAAELPRCLRDGANIALVSDAGTPGISDPGALLVRAAREARLPVVCIPGPSALSAALSIAGLPATRIAFEGFLPSAGAARRSRLRSLRGESRLLLFFEAPHRIRACLDDCVAVLGAEREAVLLKELSKLHEQAHAGTLGELCRTVAPEPRGEFVCIVRGAPETDPDTERVRRLCTALAGRLPRRELLQIVTEFTGLRRNQVYALLPHSARPPE